MLVRSATATEPRFLSFEGGGTGLELEVVGDELVGLPGVRLAETSQPSVDLADATLHDAMLNLTVIPAGVTYAIGSAVGVGVT